MAGHPASQWLPAPMSDFIGHNIPSFSCLDYYVPKSGKPSTKIEHEKDEPLPVQLSGQPLLNLTQPGKDLRNHPLADRIDSCDSPDSIIDIFQEQSRAFGEFMNGDTKLFKWLRPVVNVLHALSTNSVLSDNGSLVFPPAKAVFSGIGILLSEAKHVRESYDAPADIFECIENFLRRLRVYTEIPLTSAMTEVVIKIMVELLSVLTLATKQINRGRFKESRTAVAETLDAVYGLVNDMQVVMEGIDRRYPTGPCPDAGTGSESKQIGT
ncbi:hypothetical protein BJV77DRAFT_1161438 [Russula vinacea]|nr:hypothetical protein BJV77DRAFT_1161438 [Russula vinacea]